MNYNSISGRHKSGSTLIWLAYVLFIFIQPIFAHSTSLWVATLVAVAIFLAIFFVYIGTASEKTRRWMILATFVLALTVFPWNSGASTFFVYTAAFIPFSFESTSVVLALFGVEALGIALEGWIFRSSAIWLSSIHVHIDFYNVLFALFLMLVIGGGNIFFAQQRRADNKLRAAQEENVALAAVAERERIARDLHDVLGHTLSVIVLKAELARRLIDTQPERAAAEIADVEASARTALAEVREAIGGYRSQGLLAEIDNARRTLDAAGVALMAEATREQTAQLSAAEETVLSLALREAVTNIVRHAQAKQCRLRFVSEEKLRSLSVEDDGENGTVREGNGLRGMRERVEALGGTLRLEQDRGTRLLIELPLQKEPA